MQLKNFIVKSKILDDDLCDEIVKDSKDWRWKKHTWYSHNDDKSTHSHQEKELDVVFVPNIPEEINDKLLLGIESLWRLYQQILPSLLCESEEDSKPMAGFNMIKFWSSVRLNRYSQKTLMRSHYDHIQSLFDGNVRGIPILSAIGALNNSSDYEGGSLKFWDNYEVNLNKGEILMFPSCFLYPHKVEEVIIGERYTFVSWGV